MDIFISWSGNRSKKVAELLSNWLQCVIQAAKPWVSTQDIEGGTLWFNEINNQLANTTTGLICLTKENRNKPWILFESGALAKGLTSSRIYTFLIDLVPADLENPLAQFNHTLPNKDGMRKLVKNINTSLSENALKESILNTVFDTYWGQFEEQFKEIIANTPQENIEIQRSGDDIMNEILITVRNLDKRVRKVEKEESLKLWSRSETLKLTDSSDDKKYEMLHFMKALENIKKNNDNSSYTLKDLHDEIVKIRREALLS